MKLLLATGIYPPDIGGPATHVQALVGEFVKRGVEVRVVTYGEKPAVCGEQSALQQSSGQAVSKSEIETTWNVIRVSKTGGPLLRWLRYARALRRAGNDADIVMAFSSVSSGVPLWLAGLEKPKKILRLGGDFFWERYTDRGGRKTLREWYGSGKFSLWKWIMGKLLRTFDHVVFSTRFQEGIYEQHYKKLSPHSVIENAFPSAIPVRHEKHDPFRLLFMGRFVGFKNLPALIKAVSEMEGVTLTLVGDGPLKAKLSALSAQLSAPVTFLPSIHGEEKESIFAEYDLLILPSLTEISPNVAWEATSNGLPVLLTKETGLEGPFASGMLLREMRTSQQIRQAISAAMGQYVCEDIAEDAWLRPWQKVADAWLSLFHSFFGR